MEAYPEEIGFQFECPLCRHGIEVAEMTADACAVCGATVDIIADFMDANQFTETRNALGEHGRLVSVHDGIRWAVGHKATPSAIS